MTTTEKGGVSELEVRLAELRAERSRWRASEREHFDGASAAQMIADEVRAGAGASALDGADPVALARELEEHRAIVEISTAAAAAARERGNNCWLEEGRVLAEIKRVEAQQIRSEAAALSKRSAKLLASLVEIEGCEFGPARFATGDGSAWVTPTPRSTMMLAAAADCDIAAYQFEIRKVPHAGGVRADSVDDLFEKLARFVDEVGACTTPSRLEFLEWAERVSRPIVAELEAGIRSGQIRPGEINVEPARLTRGSIVTLFSAAGKKLVLEASWRDGRIDTGRSSAWLVDDLTPREVEQRYHHLQVVEGAA